MALDTFRLRSLDPEEPPFDAASSEQYTFKIFIKKKYKIQK